ncbi:NUDIX domain-containing protein [Plantactinospora sp. WMMB334]|uniref:NUDIX domain-containing protein n=1 Tax=Plantactinospora sp. WMMB334 TaxID=3404119 RepID=UPI003B926F39
MTGSETPPMATPRVAAGALFFDDEGRVLLVKPHYKDHWDIPGGYVEPGESPRAACIREVREELGLSIDLGPMLVIDWAPAPNEGDKLLFIFDAGTLSSEDQQQIILSDDELTEWRFIAGDGLDSFGPARLTRRIRTALIARVRKQAMYAEHGTARPGK